MGFPKYFLYIYSFSSFLRIQVWAEISKATGRGGVEICPLLLPPTDDWGLIPVPGACFAREANSYKVGDMRDEVFTGGLSGEPAAP